MSPIRPNAFDTQQLAWGNSSRNSDGVVKRWNTSGPLVRALNGKEV